MPRTQIAAIRIEGPSRLHLIVRSSLSGSLTLLRDDAWPSDRDARICGYPLAADRSGDDPLPVGLIQLEVDDLPIAVNQEADRDVGDAVGPGDVLFPGATQHVGEAGLMSDQEPADGGLHLLGRTGPFACGVEIDAQDDEPLVPVPIGQ